MIKNSPTNAGNIRDEGLIPRVGKVPWRRAWQPTPVFSPRENDGQEPGRLGFTGLQKVGHD